MSRITLSALCAAALWASALATTQAQAPNTMPRRQPGMSAPMPTPPPSPMSWSVLFVTGENPLVGSVNGKPIYWNNVLKQLIADRPEALQMLQQDITQLMGGQITQDLFAVNPKPTVTYTRAAVMRLLRQKPTQDITSTLEELIQRSVVAQELQKQDKKISDEDVAKYLNQLLKQARDTGNIPAGQTDDDFLASKQLTRAILIKRLRFNVEGLYLTQRDMEKKLGHPFGPNDFVQARHILLSAPAPAQSGSTLDKVKMEADAKADAEALTKITGIAADIKSGKIKFEDAAMQYSIDGSREKGGDVGVFSRGGMMVQPFEDAAFKLQDGEVSPPVRSQFGYHLIRVDKRGVEIPQADRDKAFDTLRNRKFQEYITDLMAHYKIERKLLAPAPTMPTGMMGGGGRPGQPGMRPGQPQMRPAPRPAPAPPSNQ